MFESMKTIRAQRRFKNLSGFSPNAKQLAFFMNQPVSFDRGEGKTTAIAIKALDRLLKGENSLIIVYTQLQIEMYYGIIMQVDEDLSIRRHTNSILYKNNEIKLVTTTRINEIRTFRPDYIFKDEI